MTRFNSSVDVNRLGVDEMTERLGAVREQLREPMSYEGKEDELRHAIELQAKILSKADAGELRAEWHAARERLSTTEDSSARSAEKDWAGYLGVTFLERANTAQLAAEEKWLQENEPDDPWRREIATELREHRLVDKLADIALDDQLSRWDILAGSRADGEHLRKLAEAAEIHAGARGLEQFLKRLDAADHKFYPDQLAHFSAAVGPDFARALGEKMQGRPVEIAPRGEIGSFWESFAADVASGEVRDNLALVSAVMGEKLVADLRELAEQVEFGVNHPLQSAENLAQAARDLPGRVVDSIRAVPDLPAQVAAALTRFEQADQIDQVKQLAGLLYEVEKGLVTDRAVDVAVGRIAEGVVGALAVDRTVERLADRVVDGTPDTPGPLHRSTEDHPPNSPTAAPTSTPEVKGLADGRTAGTGGIQKIDVTYHSADNTTVTTIEGVIKEPIPDRKANAPNFNDDKHWPAASTFGLVNYDKAHLWGPGFGDEAYDGIAYAPADFNQAWQNRGVETRIRKLAEIAAESGATIHLKAEMRTHPRDVAGGQVLAQLKYTVEVSRPGEAKQLVFEASLDVGRPPSGLVEVSPITEGPASPWGGDPAWMYAATQSPTAKSSLESDPSAINSVPLDTRLGDHTPDAEQTPRTDPATEHRPGAYDTDGDRWADENRLPENTAPSTLEPHGPGAVGPAAGQPSVGEYDNDGDGWADESRLHNATENSTPGPAGDTAPEDRPSPMTDTPPFDPSTAPSGAANSSQTAEQATTGGLGAYDPSTATTPGGPLSSFLGAHTGVDSAAQPNPATTPPFDPSTHVAKEVPVHENPAAVQIQAEAEHQKAHDASGASSGEGHQ